MTQINPQVFNELLGITESYQAPQALLNVLYDREKREQLMRDVLEATNYEVAVDTFRKYFEDEHADRRHRKQDFTPPSIANLARALIGDTTQTDGLFYEGCAGTGSMTIAAWNKDRMQHSPFDYLPSWYFYHCEELSERAIPFLVFNLAMRGMNAVVVHCDVLSRKAYGAFFIQNDNDDHMQFSSINVLPRTQELADYLAVKWDDSIDYEPLIESPAEWWNLPAFRESKPERGAVSDFTFALYAMCGVKHPHLDDYLEVLEAERESDV